VEYNWSFLEEVVIFRKIFDLE